MSAVERVRSALAVYRYGRALDGWLCRDCRKTHGRHGFAVMVAHTVARHHRLPQLEPVGYTVTFEVKP